MNIWILFLMMGVGTYLLRLSFIVLFGKVSFPEGFRKGLPFVPPTVFVALILPAVLKQGDTVEMWGNPKFFAAMVAAWVAYRTKNVVLTILVGMMVLYLLEWIM